MVNEQEIRAQLQQILYPESRHDILSLGLIGGIAIQGATVIVHFRQSNAPPRALQEITGKITATLTALPEVRNVEFHGGQQHGPASHTPQVAQHEKTPLPGVKKVVAVASGKGGVGKSTVAVNLALALHVLGNRVGLLDADIYGPSVPLMMGTEAVPRAGQEKKVYPVEKYGISLISMGFFLDDQSPVIWRGPVVMGIIRQFLHDVVWGELDYLIVDLPPGTGDVALTLAQEIPLNGGVIVSTPQEVALLDVNRGVAMFQQLKVPLFGVVENMSYYLCPHCGEREDIFGHGGTEKTGLAVLAEIPLVEEIRASGDDGKPIVLQQPDHPVAHAFHSLASKVMQASGVVLQ